MATVHAKSKGTAVATQKQGDMVLVQDTVPDYLAGKTARGNEHVTAADVAIPRLEIVQALSPAVKRGDPGYIKGAEAGMLNNSVTRKLYGGAVNVVPVHFSMQYLVWRDRKLAEAKRLGAEGGFFGAYQSMAEASSRAEQEGGEAQAVIVQETPTHLCILIEPETFHWVEVIVSMPKTKAKISRTWNALIRNESGDRFARVYEVGTTLQKSAKGDFYNYAIKTVGYPSKPLYERAEALYKQVSAGDRRVVVDVGDQSGGGADDQSDM